MTVPSHCSMKSGLSIFALAVSFTLSGCATAPRPIPLHSAQHEAVCAMIAEIEWQPFGTVAWEEDPAKVAELQAVVAEAELEELPSSIRCSGKFIRLRGTVGIPFDSFWLSPGETFAAISGGWHGGELLG